MPKDLVETDAPSLASVYRRVRARTEAWAAPLSAEDLCVQTMPDVSPGKWHLAHVTWFWETFVLNQAEDGYAPFDLRFNYLFNSYYEAVGERHARPERGFLTRPSLAEVLAYRRHVDAAMRRWFETASPAALGAFVEVVRTGIAHEEQHQELFLTDIKHVMSCNAFPEAAYSARPVASAASPAALRAQAPQPRWVRFDGGLHPFGAREEAFAFDNEGPAHKAWLEPFALATAPVTNAEYLAFMEDDGYARPEFWLSDGWAAVRREGRIAPFYWRLGDDGVWREHTLHGLEAIDPHAPVSHLDYYEADAFAAWTGARLPEEREWEHAAAALDPARGAWAEPGERLHPKPVEAGAVELQAMFAGVWEWTRSAYSPYPSYRAPKGAIGEYNGKFMCGQFVLKGGSALTPPAHMRASYRNFLPPDARWQMTGVRLARDV